MAIIGTFTQRDGGFHGSIRTLTINAKVSIVPLEQSDEASEQAPRYRVFVNGSGVEVGAAWDQTSKKGKAYLRVGLDDPSFPEYRWANLIEGEKGWALMWSRK